MLSFTIIRVLGQNGILDMIHAKARITIACVKARSRTGYRNFRDTGRQQKRGFVMKSAVFKRKRLRFTITDLHGNTVIADFTWKNICRHDGARRLIV